MKRYLLTLLILQSINYSYAQDFILLKNGDEIRCKILKVSNNSVTYSIEEQKEQIPSEKLFLIKYELRGITLFNENGEADYNSEYTPAKIGKKDICIYTINGEEIVASEVKITTETINYKIAKKGMVTNLFASKKNGEWFVLKKEDVFIIRYFDGSKDVINDLSATIEKKEQHILQKVKHPFVPINKDSVYPCPAEMEINDGKIVDIIIYDMEREYVHYRTKEWQDGPIFRMNRNKIKRLKIKNNLQHE